MNVSYSKELAHAFVATPSELKELTTLLEENIGKVEIRADCTDDISREFETIEELIAYKNPKSKELRCVYLTARSDDYEKSVRIRFLDSIWTGILIDLAGPENVVSNLKEETQDIIAGMRPWYNVLFHSKFSMTISFIFGMILTLWIQIALGYKVGEIGIISYLRDVMPINLIAAFIILSLCVLFLKKPFNYLFPKAVFLIGQGETRFKHQQNVLWGVIIAFFVSLAAGLVILIWN